MTRETNPRYVTRETNLRYVIFGDSRVHRPIDDIPEDAYEYTLCGMIVTTTKNSIYEVDSASTPATCLWCVADRR